MLYRLVFLVLMMTLFGGSVAAQPTHTVTTVLCKNRETVENHMDLIEAEGGAKASTETLKGEVKKGLCAIFPPRSLQISEQFEPRPIIKIDRNHSIRIRLLRIGPFWGIGIEEFFDA